MAYFPLFIDITGRKCLVIGGGKVALRKVETLLSYGADVRVVSPEICPEIYQMLSGSGDSGEEKRLSGSGDSGEEKRLSGSGDPGEEKRLSGSGDLKADQIGDGSGDSGAEQKDNGSGDSEAEQIDNESGDLKDDQLSLGPGDLEGKGRLHTAVDDKILKGTLTTGEMEKEIDGAALVVAASGSREANHQAAVICRRLGIPVNVVDQPSECTFLFPAVVKKGEISIGINTGGLSPIVSSVIRQEIEENVPDYYGDIAWQLGQLRSRVKKEIPEEKVRRHYLKKLAALAFSERRALSEEEIEAVLGRSADPVKEGD